MSRVPRHISTGARRGVGLTGGPGEPSAAIPVMDPVYEPDPGAILEFLAGSAKEIRESVSDGAFDAMIPAIRAAEVAGKGRKTVIRALDARIALKGG